MSYCVNCGVELAETAKKCPLCATPVINPNIAESPDMVAPFPDRVELPKGVRSQFGAFVASLLLLLPNIICIVTNLLITPRELWSVYVAAASLLLWFLVVFPFLTKKVRPYLTICADAAATALFIFVFYHYNSQHTGWFLKLALPLDIMFFLVVALLVTYFRKKRNLVKTIIACLTGIIAVNAGVCLIVNLYKPSVIVTYITVILAVSGALLLTFFAVAQRNIRLRAWLSRKFFF